MTKLRARNVSAFIPIFSMATAAATGCVGAPPPTVDEEPAGHVSSELAGANLAGANLSGANLSGTNLAGANLGGTNLAGANLGGTNLGGTNLGGNNLGGTNLAGTNLGGTNLAGTNLAGTNLAGTNLAGSNLAGTNLAGTNLGATNLTTTNLAGASLAVAGTGADIHRLGLSGTSLLYSREDLVQPKTSQSIVLGFGSTAFPRLLGQQSANARISVALGKLPWGFADVAGGPKTVDAWEAVVWGDKSYCTFILVAPPGTSWAGVAGFIKSIFRWNAPPTQSIDIGGISASAAVDPTRSTTVVTYTGMMGTAAHFLSGGLLESDFMAGELAMISATTNNQSIWVDFSAWVRDKTNRGRILANVATPETPRYAEAAFSAYTKSDGTVGISISPVPVSDPLISASDELGVSYDAYRFGQAPKPVPTRCAAAAYLNAKFGEPIPSDQCDTAVSWVDPAANPGYPLGAKAWSAMAGTTAPMNSVQLLPAGTNADLYLRTAGQPIASETYTFLWEPNHTLPGTVIGGSTGANRAALGVAVSSVAGCKSTDDPNDAFNPLATAPWCAAGAPTAAAPRSRMYTWGARIPITSYSLTSAASAATGDPRDWTFQGCDTCSAASDTGWTTLDTRTAQVFASRLLAKSYSFANTRAYAQYRVRVTANAGATVGTQIREVRMFDSGGAIVARAGVDKTENGTVSWTGKACSTSELATRAFDNLMSSTGATRWCSSIAPNSARPVSVAYTWNGAVNTIASYRVTSAGDSPTRDPKAWTFEGCDGSCKVGVDTSWVVLDTRTAEAFASRNLTKTYAIAAPKSYAQYRLRISANNGDARTQVGEVEMF
ncbi:hypothetical protein BH11MYX4_BH11MYX4_04880 [soil metagenome]